MLRHWKWIRALVVFSLWQTDLCLTRRCVSTNLISSYLPESPKSSTSTNPKTWNLTSCSRSIPHAWAHIELRYGVHAIAQRDQNPQSWVQMGVTYKKSLWPFLFGIPQLHGTNSVDLSSAVSGPFFLLFFHVWLHLCVYLIFKVVFCFIAVLSLTQGQNGNI